MILVDSTVWIDFFNGTDSIFRRKLHQLIEEEEGVYLTAINLTEILQGISSDTDFERTRRYLLLFPLLYARNLDTYIHAAKIYRTCRRSGKTVRKTVDCLIAAIAIENNLTLLHNDHDFDKIAACSKLKVFQF
ncbi:MAG TPA: PIN domain nuclease [Nitrospiria bacterium]|nr:PIN domain nuclease [Nitrospiria bacterium]